MTRTFWITAIVIALGTVAASAAVYPGLPQTVPTHWNLKGEIDGYGSKTFGAFFFPAVILGMIGLMALLPKITPRAWPIETFGATYAYITLLMTGLLAYLHAVFTMAAMGHAPDFLRSLLGGLYVFFALFGNVMGRVTRNPWVGIRVPWTLASDRVWNATHRFAARLFVAMGILGVILVAINAHVVLTLVPFPILIVVPIIYSYFIDRKLSPDERS